MPRLHFIADFPWHPRPNVTVMFRAGKDYPVTQACADVALAKGRAVKPASERKSSSPRDRDASR